MAGQADGSFQVSSVTCCGRPGFRPVERAARRVVSNVGNTPVGWKDRRLFAAVGPPGDGRGRPAGQGSRGRDLQMWSSEPPQGSLVIGVELDRWGPVYWAAVRIGTPSGRAATSAGCDAARGFAEIGFP